MEISIKSGVKFVQEKKVPEEYSDKEIISLFLERNEKALSAVSSKYGSYCGAVAKSILNNAQDAEECVNDTWLKVWETIPPQRPNNLGGFLAKIVKNISLNRYRYSRSQKRGGGEMPLVLNELNECVAHSGDVEKTVENEIVVEAVNEFLKTQPQDKRDIFVLRYWYCLSVSEIAEKMGVRRNTVSVVLSRTRRMLFRFLDKKELL